MPPPPDTPPADAFAAIIPAPFPLPTTIRHRRLGVPSRIWHYRDGTGALLFVACRFDREGGKEVLPFTFGILAGRRSWHWRAAPAPRPLYALDRLAACPDAPVLVVEGEKAADAAAGLFADHVVTTSPSGARAARMADWTALRGRTVRVWPDADAAGRAYAADVAELARAAGVRDVQVVSVPDDFPPGWDLADPPPPE